MAIKFINPKLTTKIVSISDEAIDKANSDIAAYQSSYDISLLKFVEGEIPTYFILHNVGSADLVSIQQDHYITEIPKLEPGMTIEDMKNQKVKVTPVKTGEMLVKYFKAGCKKIIDGDKEIAVDDETINMVPPNILQEIGSFVMTRSILPESKKK
jgi:hypothetical protein